MITGELSVITGGAGDVVQDLTALECGVKATCVPFSVLLQPYAIYIPGQVLVETSVKRQFRVSWFQRPAKGHTIYLFIQ